MSRFGLRHRQLTPNESHPVATLMEFSSQEAFPNLRFILPIAIIKVGELWWLVDLAKQPDFFSLMVHLGLYMWLDFYLHYL